MVRDVEARCRYDLAIVAVFQNEAPYLKEWIEFHRMMGVQHFVLVDDRSDDHYAAVLAPYLDSGEVELVRSPAPPHRRRGDAWIEFQRVTLGAQLRRLRGVARWVALIDIDEFLVPSGGETVPALLAAHEDRGALYVRWEPFGTSYVKRLRARDLLTERMVLKWRFIAGHDMLGKSIVKPHRVRRAGIHRCELVAGFTCADSNPDMASPEAAIKVHHYWSRDERFLVEVKLPRTARVKGWVVDDERVAFFKTLFNDVPDHGMKRFAAELRRRVFGRARPAPGARPRTARARRPASRPR